MRFALSEEQQGFARSLDGLLRAAGTPQVARAWAAGEPGPGLLLWRRLADIGVTALTVPGWAGGLAATHIDLAVALEALGRHVAPGPWVESVAFLPGLLAGSPAPDGRAAALAEVLAGVVEGRELVTLAAPPTTPYALDADVATAIYAVRGDTLALARPVRLLRSVDGARRLFEVEVGEEVGSWTPAVVARAHDTAALACSAQLLGLGEHLLEAAVRHACSRSQFGRLIGEYQALKHQLADVRVALDFARPLVQGAALALDHQAGETLPAALEDGAAAYVSAAKVAAGDAAHRAARVALQTHGALGYTAEHDLALGITKVRALVGAWGTPSSHRARVLASLTSPGSVAERRPAPRPAREPEAVV